MSYCTLADLIEQYSEQKIREVSDRVNKPATTIDTVIVDRAIADADSEIDLHLHGRYQLPLASVPTALKRIACGLAYANLLTGAVMTETIFAWPGLGRYTFRSAAALDFPAIMGITLVVSATYLLVNLLVDISYAALDPRVRR